MVRIKEPCRYRYRTSPPNAEIDIICQSGRDRIPPTFLRGVRDRELCIDRTSNVACAHTAIQRRSLLAGYQNITGLTFSQRTRENSKE